MKEKTKENQQIKRKRQQENKKGTERTKTTKKQFTNGNLSISNLNVNALYARIKDKGWLKG